MYHKPENEILQKLSDMAHQLRIHSIESTNASNSGHPTSCSSIAEIMSVLFFHTMKYSVNSPKDATNDRFILSKGHAAPILYAAWAEAGLFSKKELLNLRKIDSDFEGHPTPRLNFIDVGTGSLGQGLSVACGMAYVGKYLDKIPYRTYCVLGDGECAEGSVWEAFNFASYYKLDNLCVIIDINRLGQSEPTCLQHKIDVYRARVESFGCKGVAVDGHDVLELTKAFHEASVMTCQPTVILAKTIKGKHFPQIEDMVSWHGKPLGDKAEVVIKHLQGLMSNNGIRIPIPKPISQAPEVDISNVKLSEPPSYKVGEFVATRFAYGTALFKIAKNNNRVLALDGDTKNSTYSQTIQQGFPDRFIECFIAEQNLVGVGMGVTCRDRAIAFVSTFAAFFTRAFDQIRMGAISQTNLNFVGSHAGISIGPDGPSQMALEDLSLFRSIPGSTVFYPSDAVSTERAVELAANTKGICFIRTGRPNAAVIYSNGVPFEIGKGKVVKKSNADKVLVIGSGVTLHEALKASNIMKGIRVMDPFTIKPIDKEGIIKNAKECGGNIITVEDHYPSGGIGEAVMSAVAQERGIVVVKLAVENIPRSGPPDDLLEMFGISAASIVKAAKNMPQ